MTDLEILRGYLLIGALLFGLGLVGFLTRRNMIVMFLSVEMMLQGVALNLVAFSWYHNDWGGQMFVIFIITVAACEAAIALALVMMLFHRSGSLDMTFWQQNREASVAAFVDQQLPEDPESVQAWPELTPAGRLPKAPPESDMSPSRSTHA